MSAMSGFEADAEIKFATIAGPISEALIVTAAGILVAVMAVIVFNFFNQRAGRIAMEMKLLTDEFLEELEGAPRGKSKEGTDGDREAA
jgi:biopolymer transport protein ExbB